MHHCFHAANLKVLLPAMLLYIATAWPASAQYYSTGQEPSAMKWRQINTDHVRLIFPDYYEARARKLASYLDTVHGRIGKTLSYYPKRIPLVMHTQSARANALVAWAPKRMEFYTTPPQDTYAQPWLEQLSLHEYRHVVQIEKLNQGFTKVLSWLLGQQGTAAILGLYVPSWFLEGDAIALETGLSNSGRGRVPKFSMKLRAQLLEIGPYSYDKAVLGSYRDFIPSYYDLGYFIVAEGRRRYGAKLWEHTLNTVARRPYMVTPFQKGIRDITGKRKIPFYRECMGSLREQWLAQDRVSKTVPAEMVSPEPRHYTDYRHPKSVSDSLLIAMKTSLVDITRFVSIDLTSKGKGREKVIFTPGFPDRETLAYANGKLCWVETRPDPRWSNRSYTVIRLYGIESGESSSIRHRMRLFAPSLSPDASAIVAVNNDSLDRYSLFILDSETGKVLEKIATPGNSYPLTPTWATREILLSILVSEKGKSIAVYDLASGQWRLLLDWSYEEISQAFYHDPWVIFTAGYSGISNIYALHAEEGDIFRITSARFGAGDAEISVNGDELLFADYSSRGYRIRKLPIFDMEWTPLGRVLDHSPGHAEVLAGQEKPVPPGSGIPPARQESKKYSRIANLFNFHSWAPLGIDVSTYDIRPGVSVMSQNLLSSSFLTAGYRYNVNEKSGNYYAEYTYAGWYPLIDLSVDHGLRREDVYLPERTELKWKETNIRAGLRLPLNFRRGKYYRGLQMGAYANQGVRRMLKDIPLRFRNPDIFSAGFSLGIYSQLKSNFRDIYPRWGQRLDLYYRYTPFEGTSNAIAAAVLNLYFPGLLRHQGLNIYAGYQHREIGIYKFGDIMAYPRGVSGRQDEEFICLRSTYALPLAYPDLSIGPVLYIKRIRANLFYDHAFTSNNGNADDVSSFGGDLLAGIHVLRFPAPLEIGVRYAYLPDDASSYWSFLLSVGFSSFYVNTAAGSRLIDP